MSRGVGSRQITVGLARTIRCSASTSTWRTLTHRWTAVEVTSITADSALPKLRCKLQGLGLRQPWAILNQPNHLQHCGLRSRSVHAWRGSGRGVRHDVCSSEVPQKADPGDTYYDPKCFMTMILHAAELVQQVLRESSGRVYLAARLPKPVSVGLGIRLSSLAGADRDRLVLANFDGSRFAFLPIGRQPAPTVERIVNLTPHAVRIVTERGEAQYELPGGSTPARVHEEVQAVDLVSANGFTSPIRNLITSAIDDLPAPQLGTLFVVSRITAMASQRADLVFPHGEVRDTAGQIIGVTGLARVVNR